MLVSGFNCTNWSLTLGTRVERLEKALNRLVEHHAGMPTSL